MAGSGRWVALPCRRCAISAPAGAGRDVRQWQGGPGLGRSGAGVRRYRLAAAASPARFCIGATGARRRQRRARLSPARYRLVPAHVSAGRGSARPGGGTASGRCRQPCHGVGQRHADGAQLERLQRAGDRHHARRTLWQCIELHRHPRRCRGHGWVVVRRRRHLPTHLAGAARAPAYRRRRPGSRAAGRPRRCLAGAGAVGPCQQR